MMNKQNNIDALNNLALKVTGENSEALSIPEAINFIAENYKGASEDLSVYKEMMIDHDGKDFTISSDIVTNLRPFAFYTCQNLTACELPNLAKIPQKAFQYCSGLRHVNFENTTELDVSCFSGCTKLTELSFPNVKQINMYCFSQCSLLEKIDLAICEQVTSSSTLNGCASLETLILRSNKVTTLGNVNALSGTAIKNGEGYIYVPKTLLEEYKIAENWSTFADQFRAIEDYPDICGGE